MEIDHKTKEDILFFLDNQKMMYEMSLKDSKCTFVHRQGINMLMKRLNKLIDKLNL